MFGFLRSLRHATRLLGIGVTLARHDALFLVEPLVAARPLLRIARLVRRRGGVARPGERLAAAFQEIGPAFIKLGQMLATRADLLGVQPPNYLDRTPALAARRGERTRPARPGLGYDGSSLCRGSGILDKD